MDTHYKLKLQAIKDILFQLPVWETYWNAQICLKQTVFWYLTSKFDCLKKLNVIVLI